MEIWKDIIGYEGLYQISDLGRLKSLEKIISNGKGGFRKRKEIIINPKSDRYTNVSLVNNGLKKQYTMHRLVAISFIPNPENKKEVNHINGVKNDNSVYNLEWCTREENCIHSFNTGLSKPYWKCKNRSNETKIKISNNQKGRVSNRKGVVLSQETKDKISIKLKGNIPWNKGKKIKK